MITWMLFSLFAYRLDPESPTTITLPEVDTSTPYFPETESTLALLAGGIPLAVRSRLSSLLPPCDIPGLLRLLRYTLLEHQYQTWIRRNEAQPRLDHKPSYARPKRLRPVPASPEPPPRNRKRKRRSQEDTWSRNRAAWKRLRTYVEDLPTQKRTLPRTTHHQPLGDAPQQPREPTFPPRHRDTGVQPLDRPKDPPAELG